MSLKHAANTHSGHTSRISGINEMQREDFLALAAALRQFNGYPPLVSLTIVNARQGAEGYARQASE